MDTIKFLKDSNIYDVKLTNVGEGILQLIFSSTKPSNEILKRGFHVLATNGTPCGKFEDYKNIYCDSSIKSDMNVFTVQLTNVEGKVYEEPIIVEPEIIEPTAEEIAEQEKQSKIASLNAEIENYKNLLAETDYIFVKVTEDQIVNATTEYSDEYLLEIHTQRDTYRAKINELQDELASLTETEVIE